MRLLSSGFPLGTVVPFGGLPVPLFPSVLPPGTVVAAGGPSVPFGRSGWKQNASTWNSDIGNGRFCCRPPFQVKGRGRSRLIIAFHASHLARSSPLGDRRCRLAVPGGSKLLPPGTLTGGKDVSVATLRSRGKVGVGTVYSFPSRLSTGHGRRRWGTAGAVWPFRVEAKCLHLELRPGEWTFLLPPSVLGGVPWLRPLPVCPSPGGVPWLRSLPVSPSPGGVAEVDSQCK